MHFSVENKTGCEQASAKVSNFFYHFIKLSLQRWYVRNHFIKISFFSKTWKSFYPFIMIKWYFDKMIKWFFGDFYHFITNIFEILFLLMSIGDWFKFSFLFVWTWSYGQGIDWSQKNDVLVIFRKSDFTGSTSGAKKSKTEVHCKSFFKNLWYRS